MLIASSAIADSAFASAALQPVLRTGATASIATLSEPASTDASALSGIARMRTSATGPKPRTVLAEAGRTVRVPAAAAVKI